MKKTLTLLSFYLSTCLLYSQLANWPLTSNLNGTGGPGITVHPVSFGSGYSSPGTLQYNFGTNCGCTGLRIWNWRVTGSPAPSLNGATAVSQNRYVEFSFTNNTGSNLTISSFSFTGNGGFASNCSATSPYASIRWLIDGNATYAAPQWIRNTNSAPSLCGAEHSLALTGGACYTYTRPGTGCSDGWRPANPIVLANGERVRFRLYVATTNDQNTWMVTLNNVSINGANPLAVTLSSFNAGCEGTGTDVHWSTESERNASHFDLERSRDGEVWETAATVPANGNSYTTRHYSVKDPVHYVNTGYYRLRQVDYSGEEQVYGPVVVNWSSTDDRFVVFPNPASESFAVEISSNNTLEEVSAVVYDLNGKPLLRQSAGSNLKGVNRIYFSDKQLAKGTYLIVVETPSKNNFVPEKLIIQ